MGLGHCYGCSMIFAFSVDNTGMSVWLGLLALSLVLGVGLSWSHVRRALSGQADMGDVDS